MPKAKLDTAVRPIVAPSGRKVLLANDRIVTALENDLDQAYVPGSLVEMLKQRSSGNASDAERFYEPMQPEYLDRDARLKQLTEQQIERSIMYPGGWALMAEEYLKGIDPLYDNIESFNKWINEDWGFAYPGPDLRPGDALDARPRPAVRGDRPRVECRRPLRRAARRPRLRTVAR